MRAEQKESVYVFACAHTSNGEGGSGGGESILRRRRTIKECALPKITMKQSDGNRDSINRARAPTKVDMTEGEKEMSRAKRTKSKCMCVRLNAHVEREEEEKEKEKKK